MGTRVPSRRLTGVISVAVVLTMLTLSACSSSASSSSPSLLTQIVQRGTLRVGTITGNAPFESLDSSGNLVGYDIDVINLLAKEMGVKVQYVKTDVAGRVTVLETGKADVTVGSFTRTPQRAEVVAFSDPINLEYVALIASAGSSATTVADFNNSNAKIAVATGGTQQAAVAQALPQATALQVPGIADELDAVTSGKADAAAVANTQIGTLMKANPGKFKVIQGALTPPQDDCIGVPLGDFAWWLYVNQFVHDINADGTTYTLYQKWFGPGSSPGPFSVPPAGSSGS